MGIVTTCILLQMIRLSIFEPFNLLNSYGVEDTQNHSYS